MEALYREGLLDEFRSPSFPELPPAAFPPHRHYVADRFNFFTIGYNTRLVKPNEVPNAYNDLLHPRFAGRIGLEAGDVDWFGAMVKTWASRRGWRSSAGWPRPGRRCGAATRWWGSSSRLARSRSPPNIYNHNAERLAVQGAPIRWKALPPTFGRPNSIGVVRRAPHPHAAMLFADFLLSREGQTMLKDAQSRSLEPRGRTRT